MVVGIRNSTTGTAESSLFTVGNGPFNSRSNALEVLITGEVLAPTLTSAMLDTAPDTALVTKEYVNSLIEDIDGGGGGAGPTTQNLQLVGTNSYKILTNRDDSITYGSNSLYFGDNNNDPRPPLGATLGDNSVSFGRLSKASGNDSMAGGTSSRTYANAGGSIAWGQNATTSHNNSFAFGSNLGTYRSDSMVVGVYNDTSSYTSQSSLFTVGNGFYMDNSNALEVLHSGEVLAPSMEGQNRFDDVPPTTLTTKEYVTNPNTLIEVLTNAQQWQLDEIKSLLGIS